MDWKDQTVLITGGSGSFGREMTQMMVRDLRPKKLIIFSRDELKQYEMRKQFDAPFLRFFIGDVRDKDRLYRAFDNVDIVIHAAALKQVPAAEYNPIEAIKTNVIGASNVIDAAIDRGVKRVIALSTDKAANPINLYGATKLCSDKLFISANAYSGEHRTRFGVVRYGNVIASRGSVIPLFLDQKARMRPLTITDPRMTRFWISLEQGVAFVKHCVEIMHGGEIFVPKLPSMRVTDLARILAPECGIEVVGIRPGEKLHEVMVPMDDARHTVELSNLYVIRPEFPWWAHGNHADGIPCAEDFEYTSDKNDRWLSEGEIRDLLQRLGIAQVAVGATA